MKTQLNRKKYGALQAAAWISLSAHCGAAMAQETAHRELKANETYRFVPVKNVSPDLLAWRIDPEHQKEPQSLVENRRLSAQFNIGTRAPTTTKTSSPGGNFFAVEVRALLPVENPRGLFVAASDEQLEKLRTIVQALDQPQRRVAIDIKVVRLEEKSKTSQEMFAARNGTANTLFLSSSSLGNLQDDLDKQLAQTLYAAHVTTLSNFTALTQSDPTQTGTLWKFLVAPTVNNDDTITLALKFETRTTGTFPEAAPADEAIGAVTQRNIQTVVNMRDGDTVLLGGLNKITGLTATNAAGKVDQNVEIVVITARTLPATVENQE